MNVASLELCRELYIASKWGDTYFGYSLDVEGSDKPQTSSLNPTGVKITRPSKRSRGTWIPAYDLGYLLRKLPAHTQIKKRKYQSMEEIPVGGNHAITAIGFTASLSHEVDDGHSSGIPKITNYGFTEKTPEDAACLLAIELHKQGILKASAGIENNNLKGERDVTSR